MDAAFDFTSVFINLQAIFLGFFNSWFFFVFKLFMAVYVTVLFVDIVLLLILYGFSEVRTTFYGAGHPASYKGQTIKAWKKIQKRMESEDSNQWKAAVLEADMVTNDIMGKAGYKGSNMAEKLAVMPAIHAENKDQLLWAHDVRNTIVLVDSFVLDKQTADRAVETFRDFLKSWEAL